MNLFSYDEFLTSLARIYYPHKKHHIGLFKLDGKIFRLLIIDGKKIITSFPFLDYHEALEQKPKIKPANLDFLPKAVISIKSYDGKVNNPLVNVNSSVEFAPYIDLANFNNWRQYLDFLDCRDHDLISNSNRRIRKLTREIGLASYEFNSPDNTLIDKCIDWKSRHYDKFGSTDLFFDRRHSKFFKLLQQKGILIVSTLSAAGKLIAVNIGAQYDHNYYGSICAYDRRFAAYAPGRLLLHFLIGECIRRKFRQFDFLLGEEDYKWKYVTNYRVVGFAGTLPLSQKLFQYILKIRFFAKSRFPGIYYLLKKSVISGRKLLLPRK